MHSALQCRKGQKTTVQYTQHNTEQHNTEQHSTAHPSPAQHTGSHLSKASSSDFVRIPCVNSKVISCVCAALQHNSFKGSGCRIKTNEKSQISTTLFFTLSVPMCFWPLNMKKHFFFVSGKCPGSSFCFANQCADAQ
jgi:hypothetical protein